MALYQPALAAISNFSRSNGEAQVREFHDLEASLLDRDGSCRDLNFVAPTWAGVVNMLSALEKTAVTIVGTDHDGNTLTSPFRESALLAAKKCGYAHLLISHVVMVIAAYQVFVSCEDDGPPFVEVTFFPQNVVPAASLRDDFIAWAQQLQWVLGARRCYARYENASWRFGDTSLQSGVFWVSD